MQLTTLHRRTVEYWVSRVAAIGADQWDHATPCSQWSVRDLVNHVVGEELWTEPLLRGQTIEEVGDRFAGDVLASDPLTAARDAAAAAVAVVDAIVPAGGTVHLSFGETDMGEYVRKLSADHLIHGWDLAVATGGDSAMEPDLVSEVAGWFEAREGMYRGAGVVGPRGAGNDQDPQADLLAGFGRDSLWGPNHAVLARFSAAFRSRDVDAIMALNDR